MIELYKLLYNRSCIVWNFIISARCFCLSVANAMRNPSKNARPPGPRSIVPGSLAFEFIKEPIEFLSENVRTYGDFFYFQVGRQHVYFVNDPDIIFDVLVTNSLSFVKSPATQLLKRVLGDGLLTTEGEVHARQRKLMQHLFFPENIKKSYARMMIKTGNSLSHRWHDGQIINIQNEMASLTLDVVSQTLFGSDIDESELAELSKQIAVLIHYFNSLRMPLARLTDKVPILPANIRVKNAREKLDQMIFRMIDQHKANRSDNLQTCDQGGSAIGDHENEAAGKRTDLISLLLAALEDSPSLRNGPVHENTSERCAGNSTQIRDQAMTIFLAGHETTAVALTWTFYLLSQHPEVEEKLLEELDSVVEGRVNEGSGRSLFTVEDLTKLKYTEKVFLESLRLYPPSWAIGRKAVNNYKIREYTIPRNSIVIMSQYFAHRNNDYFPKAEKFIPERWTSEMKMRLPKFAYFPFGGGIRSCIGESFAMIEGILMIAILAYRWKMTVIPDQDIILFPSVTLRSRNGIEMKLFERNKKLHEVHVQK